MQDSPDHYHREVECPNCHCRFRPVLSSIVTLNHVKASKWTYERSMTFVRHSPGYFKQLIVPCPIRTCQTSIILSETTTRKQTTTCHCNLL